MRDILDRVVLISKIDQRTVWATWSEKLDVLRVPVFSFGLRKLI